MSSSFLTGSALGLQAFGTKAAYDGTLASGEYARIAGELQGSSYDYQADQTEAAIPSAIAIAQRSAFDKKLQTRLALGTLAARAGASGVNPSVGSPLASFSELEARGDYLASMDLWGGLNRAAGLGDVAKGLRYSGDIARSGGLMKQDASRYSAAATLASGFGSMVKTTSDYLWPRVSGRTA